MTQVIPYELDVYVAYLYITSPKYDQPYARLYVYSLYLNGAYVLIVMYKSWTFIHFTRA